MYPPKQSYRIWFTQRTGSTLLCKGLEQTSIAGKPREYFNLMEQSFSKKYGITTFEELKQKLWRLGTSKNGIFGIKHSWRGDIYQRLFEELQQLRGTTNTNEEALLDGLFPNCKHIYLTRRNKVRQAVSWWKAIKNHVWHIPTELNPQKNNDSAIPTELSHQETTDFYNKNYNFAALSHLFKEATLKECAIQAYFTKHGITPLTIVYEDFMTEQGFALTIRRIIDYLDIEGVDSSMIKIPPMFYQKTSNAHSEEWVQRFRADIRKEMEHHIW